MSYGFNVGGGGPIGDHIGFWGGPILGYTTNLVQGPHGKIRMYLRALQSEMQSLEVLLC